MIRFTFLSLVLLLLTPACFGMAPAADPESGIQLDTLELPAGFAVEVYARVPGARSLAAGPPGVVFVGSKSGDSVHTVVDSDQDGTGDHVYAIGSGLRMPNGVAFRDGDLYVAEVSRILRYDDIMAHLHAPPKPVVLFTDLPSDRHHGWKTLGFGTDGWLYFQVGAPCNVCLEENPIYATIQRLQPQSKQLETLARGVRNSVGFDWQPGSGLLWFTDNGRDWLGDNAPPDELNVVTERGQHFGFPYCHGESIADPEFGDLRPCSDFQPPALSLGPHVAALGIEFYNGEMFPSSYQGDLFIAEHGSWNRTVPIGYRVTVVEVDGTDASDYHPFASGWLQGEEAWGRPVDVLELADGSILVSDDRAGAIYRITYSDDARTATPTRRQSSSTVNDR